MNTEQTCYFTPAEKCISCGNDLTKADLKNNSALCSNCSSKVLKEIIVKDYGTIRVVV